MKIEDIRYNQNEIRIKNFQNIFGVPIEEFGTVDPSSTNLDRNTYWHRICCFPDLSSRFIYEFNEYFNLRNGLGQTVWHVIFANKNTNKMSYEMLDSYGKYFGQRDKYGHTVWTEILRYQFPSNWKSLNKFKSYEKAKISRLLKKYVYDLNDEDRYYFITRFYTDGDLKFVYRILKPVHFSYVKLQLNVRTINSLIGIGKIGRSFFYHNVIIHSIGATQDMQKLVEHLVPAS